MVGLEGEDRTGTARSTIREAIVSEVDFAAMRAAMVASQLRTSDVNDPAVIAAMAQVPREDYVPTARRETCYTDRPIALGNGREMNPPLATGRLLAGANISEGDKVLLLGDATGYVAALLDRMGAQTIVVGEGGKPAHLSKSAKWVSGAPAKGYASGAPYNAIVIDGGIYNFPAALTTQLADDGRIATGLIERGVTRLCVGRKAGSAIGFVRLGDMEMATVPGFELEKVTFTF